MKPCVYAEFYHMRDGRYVDGVGSFRMFVLDGRHGMERHKQLAGEACRRRGYDGFRIARGTFSDPSFLTAVIPAPPAPDHV